MAGEIYVPDANVFLEYIYERPLQQTARKLVEDAILDIITHRRGLFRDHLYILRFRLPKRPFFRYKERMANLNNLAIERDVL